jgi:methylglutaconyl-CoA hydratase
MLREAVRFRMSGEFVHITNVDGVATVTIRRPELHNAFNETMIRELGDAFTLLGKYEDVRVIILASEGKSFCAGADLNWMKKMVDYTFDENVADAQALADMLKTIHDCPKPVIARVHGAAFGGGVGLIAACDMAVSVASAMFCLSEVKLGLLPAVISPFVLKKIGPSAAHRYFLTAERFTAAEAHRIGLVSEVYTSEGEVDEQIARMVESLKANGPEAVSNCKILISDVLKFDWDNAMTVSTQMIAERRISAEGQEGMKAFLEKRSPHWVEGEKVVNG